MPERRPFLRGKNWIVLAWVIGAELQLGEELHQFLRQRDPRSPAAVFGGPYSQIATL